MLSAEVDGFFCELQLGKKWMKSGLDIGKTITVSTYDFRTLM